MKVVPIFSSHNLAAKLMPVSLPATYPEIMRRLSSLQRFGMYFLHLATFGGHLRQGQFGSDDLLETWTNFFKFDDPNGKVKEIWRPYTDENQQFMIFQPGGSGDARPAIGLPGHPQQIGMVQRSLGR